MDGVTALWLLLVCLVSLGAFWFRVLRPMLEDFGILRPIAGREVSSVSDVPPPAVMSRSADAPPSAPSVSETDDVAASDRPMMAVPARDQMLDIFRVLRARGVSRGELAGPWRAAGLPLDNNAWAQAAPPAAPPDAPPREIAIRHNGGEMVAALPPRRGPYYPDRPDLEYDDPPA